MKVLQWYRIDCAFKLRLATLCTVNLSYEEKLQRLEELIWLRDEIKCLIEEGEYEQTIQKSADEDGAAKKLECGQVVKWSAHSNPDDWVDTSGSRGCCEGGQCKIP